VVCQVVHKRSPGRRRVCGVEFTEPEEHLEGVSFPDRRMAAQVPPTAEAVWQRRGRPEDDRRSRWRNEERGVAQLKDEVGGGAKGAVAGIWGKENQGRTR